MEILVLICCVAVVKEFHLQEGFTCIAGMVPTERQRNYVVPVMDLARDSPKHFHIKDSVVLNNIINFF